MNILCEGKNLLEKMEEAYTLSGEVQDRYEPLQLYNSESLWTDDGINHTLLNPYEFERNEPESLDVSDQYGETLLTERRQTEQTLNTTSDHVNVSLSSDGYQNMLDRGRMLLNTPLNQSVDDLRTENRLNRPRLELQPVVTMTTTGYESIATLGQTVLLPPVPMSTVTSLVQSSRSNPVVSERISENRFPRERTPVRVNVSRHVGVNEIPSVRPTTSFNVNRGDNTVRFNEVMNPSLNVQTQGYGHIGMGARPKDNRWRMREPVNIPFGDIPISVQSYPGYNVGYSEPLQGANPQYEMGCPSVRQTYPGMIRFGEEPQIPLPERQQTRFRPGEVYANRPDYYGDQFNQVRMPPPYTSVGRPKTPVIFPDKFDGSVGWQDYFAHFELCADLNKWTLSEKANYLAVSLRGSAQQLLGDLSPDMRQNYMVLVDTLRARFGSEGQNELYRAQLKSRQRKPNETLPELAQGIRRLITRGYPTASTAVREVLALDNFIDALLDSDTRLRLKQNKPANLDECVRMAIELEAFQKAESERFSGRKKFVRATKMDESESNNGQHKLLLDKISSLEKQVSSLLEQKKNNFEKSQKVVSPGKSSEKNDRQNDTKKKYIPKDLSKIQCYKCKQFGHYKSDCPELKDDVTNETKSPSVPSAQETAK